MTRSPTYRYARTDLTPHLPQLREQLLEQRGFRRDQLAELWRSPHPAARTPADPRHEVDLVLWEAATRALDDIDTALRLMEAGAYGRCQGCSAAIPLERLEVLPASTLCMPCQHDREVGAR